jgi:hypothetical protein
LPGTVVELGFETWLVALEPPGEDTHTLAETITALA